MNTFGVNLINQEIIKASFKYPEIKGHVLVEAKFAAISIMKFSNLILVNFFYIQNQWCDKNFKIIQNIFFLSIRTTTLSSCTNNVCYIKVKLMEKEKTNVSY